MELLWCEATSVLVDPEIPTDCFRESERLMCEVEFLGGVLKERTKAVFFRSRFFLLLTAR